MPPGVSATILWRSVSSPAREDRASSSRCIDRRGPTHVASRGSPPEVLMVRPAAFASRQTAMLLAASLAVGLLGCRGPLPGGDAPDEPCVDAAVAGAALEVAPSAPARGRVEALRARFAVRDRDPAI